MGSGSPWSWNETLAAFALYCAMPPSDITVNNRQISLLSKAIQRTPKAVCAKLYNLQNKDPRDLRDGLPNGSHYDRQIWVEYANRREDLLAEAVQQFKLFVGDISLLDIADNAQSESHAVFGESISSAVHGINRQFFRNSLLDNYDEACCLTGLNTKSLLVATHIKPWSDSNQEEKVAPDNGLLLNSLHSKAFQQGLISISKDLTILVSSSLPKEGAYSDYLWRYEGQRIRQPKRFAPRRDYIDYHNDIVFQR